MPKFSYLSLRKALRRSNLIHKSPALRSTRGMSSVYIIIFILALAFAIMLSGGGGSLFTGNIASPDIPTPTKDPLATPAAGSSPTTSPSVSTWKITVSLGICNLSKQPYKYGSITVDGTTTGDLELFVDGKSVSKLPFSSPQQKYTLTLSNDLGFNTKAWKLNISSKGEIKATYEGQPTGC